MIETRIIPVRSRACSVYAECDVKIAQAWSVEVLLDDNTWDSHEILKFYDEEHKWEVLETAREICRDLETA